MKFEEFENLWHAQPATTLARVPDLAECRRRMQPELNRRGRLLLYSLGTIGLFLVLYPLLSFANARHQPPEHPVLFAVNVALHVGFMATLFFWGIRQWERHRALARESTGSLRETAGVSLRNVEAEIRDCRANAWVMPILFGLTLLSLLGNQPAGAGFAWWAPRLALTAGFYACVTGLFTFHYHANLKPALARWTSVLRATE